MRDIDMFVLHCADTPNGKHFTVEDIDSWHKERDFNRRKSFIEEFNPTLGHIGYHYVVYIDGSIHAGRSEEEIGAHAEGYNTQSLGICMIGKDKFTEPQWTALKNLLSAKLTDYPNAKIVGHYQVAINGKTCPNFNVPEYTYNHFTPDEKNVLTV